MGYLKEKIEDMAFKLGGVEKPTQVIPKNNTASTTTYTGTDKNGAMSWDVNTNNKPDAKNKRVATPRRREKKDDDEVALIPNDNGEYDVVKGQRYSTIVPYTTKEIGRTAAIGAGGLLIMPAIFVGCLLLLGFGFKLMLDFIIANQSNIELSFNIICIGLLKFIGIIAIAVSLYLITRSFNEVIVNKRGQLVAKWAIGITIFLSFNFFIISCSTTATYNNFIAPTIHSTHSDEHGLDKAKGALNDLINQPINKGENNEVSDEQH